MLCVLLQEYNRACSGVAGGISDIAIFDPSDFNFTQTTATSPYSAVALRAGATAENGGKFFIINFQYREAEWTWKQSKNGCASKYEHEFKFQLAENSNTLTNFLQALDAASCCCGIGIAARLNSGKIIIAGEKYVNASSITKFVVEQDGSDGGSGKELDNPNVGNILLKGNYSRNLREYSGTWASIEALM
ncbi:hypothetical protein [Chitinophaga tropicalis]|uniref:Uncharacterized protein n=1 Tax=Chitinophaga tropicalis TaxID=2683588 RepID=A0A7K1UAI4_9BACT|nr:hypothetical protein [Chitinophaga tropicalis]MVT11382.1 hypothetical protein [Chitinophaga tropicalis]